MCDKAQAVTMAKVRLVAPMIFVLRCVLILLSLRLSATSVKAQSVKLCALRCSARPGVYIHIYTHIYAYLPAPCAYYWGERHEVQVERPWPTFG